MDRIPVSGPWITQKEIDYVTDAVTNAWYSNANMYHMRFEKAFAEYVGRKYAIALPSCTAALHLSLLALDLQPGDEVIVPEITWIATSAPISYVDATPVFADVDPNSWCLDARSLEACITHRTKAVVTVNLYGNVPNVDAILGVAKRYGIVVIEDAAESIGSEYRGHKTGSFGQASTFSFHGSKTLTTGEGGMLLTDDDHLYQRYLFLRDHGRVSNGKQFWNTEVAYKYKMSSMQAALGLAQLERVDELVERKRQIFKWYEEALVDTEDIVLNNEMPGVKNTYWMVTAVLDPKMGWTKEQLIEAMSRQNVDCRPFFYPLSSLPAYENLEQAVVARSRNTVAYRLSPWAINLPSGLNLTQAHVERVTDTLKSLLQSRP